jgi:D-alanine transaminase
VAINLYLNGQFLEPENACISVMDRGFLFGDGVYEVIPAYGGHPFRLQGHLQRLENSLLAIRMEPPLTHVEWHDILHKLLSQLPGQDQQIYLQVTRGAYSKRLHAIPERVTPTVLAVTSKLGERDPDIAIRGVFAVTVEDIRWHHCDIKAITLLANILGQQQAHDQNADHAILVRDGKAMEGASSNLFMVKEGLIITPPKSRDLLPGITRDLVLELAQQSGLAHTEAMIEAQDLDTADEIWLTSSTREVMPVTRLNDKPVADGKPGPLWRQINELYTACKARLRLHASDECI